MEANGSHRRSQMPVSISNSNGSMCPRGFAAYPQPSARKSVNQFLRSHDPSISVLRRFAKAAGVPLGQLVGE
jgi:hypothetical protein